MIALLKRAAKNPLAELTAISACGYAGDQAMNSQSTSISYLGVMLLITVAFAAGNFLYVNGCKLVGAQP